MKNRQFFFEILWYLLMKKTPEQSSGASSAVQKALLLCAVLVLCALVFVFVRLQTRQDALEETPALVTETPAAGETSPLPGIREAVVLERLADAGIVVDAVENEKNMYALQWADDASGGKFTLTLALSGGYVQGFSLLGPPLAKESGDMGAEGEALSPGEWYGLYSKTRQTEEILHTLQTLLPALLGVLETETYFPPAVSAAWLALCASAYETGSAQSDAQAGYQFTVLETAEERLLLAVNRA